MNESHGDINGNDLASRRALVRAAAGALFVGMLLGIGASALGRTEAPRESTAPPTPYSADHAKITQFAEPIATF